jgi:hypothetical protein
MGCDRERGGSVKDDGDRWGFVGLAISWVREDAEGRWCRMVLIECEEVCLSEVLCICVSALCCSPDCFHSVSCCCIFNIARYLGCIPAHVTSTAVLAFSRGTEVAISSPSTWSGSEIMTRICYKLVPQPESMLSNTYPHTRRLVFIYEQRL